MNEEKILSESTCKEVYKDTLAPTAKSVGNILYYIPRTIEVLLSKTPWAKWLTANGKKNLRLTADAIQEKVTKIPEEKLIEPEECIVTPAIWQLTYCYDSDELREMYANLLAASMNTDTKFQAHPSFVDIIKQLSPLDAKIIEKMKKAETPLPIVTIKRNYTESKSFDDLLVDYSIDLLSLSKNPKLVCSSLQNLNRLAIIKIRYDQVVKPDERYNVFYEDSIYKQYVSQYEGMDKTNITLSKGLIEFSEYGKAFCEVCCAE